MAKQVYDKVAKPRSSKLKDIYLRHGINLTRYSNHQARKLLDILDTANTQVKGIINKTNGVETKKRYNEIEKEISRITDELAVQLNSTVKQDFTALAEEESLFVKSAMRKVGVTADFELPAPTRVWSAASFGSYTNAVTEMYQNNPPKNPGKTFKQYINDFGNDVFETWDRQVRAGYMVGMTAKQITRNVLGSMNPESLQVGDMQKLRRSLEMNTRTMITHLAETARTETYKRNSNLFSGYRYIGTLDSRTCLEFGQFIETPNGDKKIENINVGDYVIGGSGKKRKVLGKACKQVEKILEIELESGKKIRCTHDHLFLTNRGWIEAGDLTSNDEIKECL